MISFQQVTKKYRQKVALDKVNLKLTKGKIIGLVGENGSGKSTMLKLIAGLTYPTKGEVLINEKTVNRRSASIVSASIASLIIFLASAVFRPWT